MLCLFHWAVMGSFAFNILHIKSTLSPKSNLTSSCVAIYTTLSLPGFSVLGGEIVPGTETNKRKTRNEGNKKRNTRALPYYSVPKGLSHQRVGIFKVLANHSQIRVQSY